LMAFMQALCSSARSTALLSIIWCSSMVFSRR
jgi:hypothetical protein